jgi:DNA-binding XRE family transcriptional regulator
MFPNLNAEQARYDMTNAQVAESLGLNRNTYEQKKKSGRFIASECLLLCRLFHCSLDYLFATDLDLKTQ